MSTTMPQYHFCFICCVVVISECHTNIAKTTARQQKKRVNSKSIYSEVREYIQLYIDIDHHDYRV